MKWLTIAMVLAACGGGRTTVRDGDGRGRRETVRPSADPAAELRALLAAEYAGLAAGDPAAVTGSWADDVLALGPRAVQVAEGREQARAMMAADLQTVKDAGGAVTWSQLEQPSVAVVGDGAWSSARLAQEVSLPSGAQRAELRVTHVWFKRSDGWRVAATHWSIELPAAEAAPLPGIEGGGPPELTAALDAALPAGTQRVDARAALAPDGKSGFAAAVVTHEGKPARVLAPLVRDAGGWRAALVHLSYGAPD